jgi:hypothetical protein
MIKMTNTNKKTIIQNPLKECCHYNEWSIGQISLGLDKNGNLVKGVGWWSPDECREKWCFEDCNNSHVIDILGEKKDDEVDIHNFHPPLQTCDIFCRNCKKTSVLEIHFQNILLGYIVHPTLDSKLVNMKDAVVVEKVKQNRKMFSLLIYCPVCGLLAEILDDVPNNYNVLSGKEAEKYIHGVSFG